MTEEMKENDATRYLVVMFEAKGAPLAPDESMFTVISEHCSPADAEKVARDRAMADPHDRTFTVYQKIGSARAAREVTWKGAVR